MRCRGRESWRSGSARFLVTALMLMLAVASARCRNLNPQGSRRQPFHKPAPARRRKRPGRPSSTSWPQEPSSWTFSATGSRSPTMRSGSRGRTADGCPPCSGSTRPTARLSPLSTFRAHSAAAHSSGTVSCGPLTTTPHGVAKIDSRRNKIVKEVSLAVPDDLDCELTSAAGEDGVWVITDADGCVRCRIAKLDRDLGVRASIPVTEGAAGVRAGLGSVWVSNPEADIVEQIDLKRLKVANKITTGDRPRYMAIGAGSIWALAQVDGSITRYTPATKETIRIEAGLSGAGGDMTFGAGSVWARGAGDRLLIRLDPATNQVVSEYGPAFGAGAVAVGHGAVWISAYNEKKAWRLPLPE